MKFQSTMKLLTSILTACTVLSGSTSAALLITEQFDNGLAEDASLIGVAGSSGNNWVSSSGTVDLLYSTTSLTYGSLPTAGGSAQVGANGGLPQQAFTLDNTGERYFSFIFQHNNASNVSGGRILFEALGSSNEGYGINYNYDSALDTAIIFARAGNTNPNSVTVGAGSPILVVGRFTPDGVAGGTTTIWVNPTDFTDITTIGSSSVGTAASTNASVTRDDGIAFRSTTSPTGIWMTVDDMRLAATYSELNLIPEPSAPALLLGGVGVLMLIRRRNG